MTANQTLTEEFMRRHGIEKVVDCFDQTGQKIVYIVVMKNGTQVALKLFRNCSERDIQEIGILKKYKGLSGIPSILKVEDDGGSPLLFEEYIDGKDLEDVMGEYAGDSTRIATLIRQVAEILKPLWENDIVHRDLKPRNIKILKDGTPVVMDFGIARDLKVESITQTGDGQPMTWDYASPEQYKGEKASISYRTDFFALGIIAYRLYYQRRPFGNTRAEIEQKFAAKDNVIALDSNCALNDFLKSALVIEPSGRPRNVEILLSTLK